MQVKFTLLRPTAVLPRRSYLSDVGLDVFTPEAGVLEPGPNKIPLGFSVEVPVGYSAEIRPRSGMASGEKTKELRAHDNKIGIEGAVKVFRRNGVAILATDPPIDPGYTGEVHAIVVNTSDLYIEYPEHTRFGQLVFYPIAYAIPYYHIEETPRGNNGFGSTGV